ncbi:MAG: HlyD family secretion protein [Gemmataceae bacterium]
MSTQVNGPDLEQERRRIAARLEEIARLSESNVPAGAFYGEMLKRLLETLAAPAGDVWARTPQGNLQLQYQINLKEIGLDQKEEWRQSHEELLRQAVTQPRPFHVPPNSGVGVKEEGKPLAGNLTNYLLLIAPIVVNQQVAGLIEVWQHANRPPQAIAGYLQYMTYMAELCARYQRNQIMGQLSGQQQVWTQLEAFARQVHCSLNPTEVAYQAANEGRRLVECDRVSVAIRQYGSKARIESVSGADVVERRSNLIRLMQKLCEQVIIWGEKLIFNGVRDDSLPPKVLSALDGYLAESNSKLLVVQPLRDERENGLRPPRSALLMECFEPPAEPQQLIARLDVVARHATPALYNAVEHRRIPGRWVWQPLAKMQDGIGGKTKALTAAGVGLTSFLIALLFLVPYELKMDSTGKLVPWARRTVYAPTAGQVKEFKVDPGSVVNEKTPLAVLYSPELFQKLSEMDAAIDGIIEEMRAAERGTSNAPSGQSAKDQSKELMEGAENKKEMERRKQRERQEFVENNNANPAKPGEYYLRAPTFTSEERDRLGHREWTVLNGNFNEEWRDRYAKPSDAILKLGAKDGPWELELRIPQKHISQVLKAYEGSGVKDLDEGKALDVDFLLRSDPTRTYRGLLFRDHISSEAIPNRDEKDESEPEVIAFVTIDHDSIDPAYKLSREALTSGTEIRAKVRCGKHAMGYSLFYGVWEFLYEKVVFFF